MAFTRFFGLLDLWQNTQSDWFLKQYYFAGGTFLIRTCMKGWSIVIWERTDLQHSGYSIVIELCGTTSIWGSQKDMFHCKFSRKNTAITDPAETTGVKHNFFPRTEKKFKFLHFYWKHLTDVKTSSQWILFQRRKFFDWNMAGRDESCTHRELRDWKPI